MIDLSWILNLVLGVAIGSTLGTLIGYKIFEKMFYRRRRKWISYVLDALEEELRSRIPKYLDSIGRWAFDILFKPSREEKKDETAGIG
jgi:membrane protein YqaA with SNARE-associated domain